MGLIVDRPIDAGIHMPAQQGRDGVWIEMRGHVRTLAAAASASKPGE
jgi:hypothetical protein